jgi:hypothetical protein
MFNLSVYLAFIEINWLIFLYLPCNRHGLQDDGLKFGWTVYSSKNYDFTSPLKNADSSYIGEL